MKIRFVRNADHQIPAQPGQLVGRAFRHDAALPCPAVIEGHLLVGKAEIAVLLIPAADRIVPRAVHVIPAAVQPHKVPRVTHAVRRAGKIHALNADFVKQQIIRQRVALTYADALEKHAVGIIIGIACVVVRVVNQPVVQPEGAGILAAPRAPQAFRRQLPHLAGHGFRVVRRFRGKYLENLALPSDVLARFIVHRNQKHILAGAVRRRIGKRGIYASFAPVYIGKRARVALPVKDVKHIAVISVAAGGVNGERRGTPRNQIARVRIQIGNRQLVQPRPRGLRAPAAALDNAAAVFNRLRCFRPR